LPISSRGVVFGNGLCLWKWLRRRVLLYHGTSIKESRVLAGQRVSPVVLLVYANAGQAGRLSYEAFASGLFDPVGTVLELFAMDVVAGLAILGDVLQMKLHLVPILRLRGSGRKSGRAGRIVGPFYGFL